MNNIEPETPEKKLPFNNLYLLSGLVNGQNKGWMYSSTLLFLILGYSLFQLFIFYPLMQLLLKNGYSESDLLKNNALIFDSVALGIDKNWVLLLELGMFVFAFFGFFIGLRFLHKKTLTSVLTGYQKFRKNRFWFAFLVWSIFLILSVLATYIFSPNDLKINFNATGFIFSLLIMLVFMPIQTGLEEVVFRGYLIQSLAQVFKNGIIPLVITSLLFGLAHMSNPEVTKFGWQLMLPYYVMFAVFMGSITLIDEGLELAFGIHFANNLISSVLLSSSSSVIKTYSIFETQNENPATEIVVWLIVASLTFFIFMKKYKWTNFKLLIK